MWSSHNLSPNKQQYSAPKFFGTTPTSSFKTYIKNNINHNKVLLSWKNTFYLKKEIASKAKHNWLARAAVLKSFYENYRIRNIYMCVCQCFEGKPKD